MLTKSKLEKLELRALKLQQLQGKALKPIPEKWEDFARLCTIRSGGRMVQFEPYPWSLD